MKTSNLLVILVMGCCFLVFSQKVKGQYIHGRTSVNYDQSTNTVTATSSTQIDYAAQDYYQGYVNIRLTDNSGNTLAVVTRTDTDRDGFVEYSTQFAGGAEGTEYTLKGTHRGRMSIQDPAFNLHYVDYYYFSWYSDVGVEGETVWRYLPFFGRGPRKNRPSSMLTMGNTVGTNIVLPMPQGFSPGPAVWNTLTPAEKKFVIQYTDAAILFYVRSQDALTETQRRFSPSETTNGRGDAWRHAYWSSLMASSIYGEQRAEEYGNAHEDFPGNLPAVRNMDLHNNSVGRQIARDNPGATTQELQNLITLAVQDGRLIWICPGPNCPPPPPS